MSSNHSDGVPYMIVLLHRLTQTGMLALNTYTQLTLHNAQILAIQCQLSFRMQTEVISSKQNVNWSRGSLEDLDIKIWEYQRQYLAIKLWNHTSELRKLYGIDGDFPPTGNDDYNLINVCWNSLCTIQRCDLKSCLGKLLGL